MIDLYEVNISVHINSMSGEEPSEAKEAEKMEDIVKADSKKNGRVAPAT